MLKGNVVKYENSCCFKNCPFHPIIPKYTFYSEGIVSVMPTLDGEIEKPTAPVCRLLLGWLDCLDCSDMLWEGDKIVTQEQVNFMELKS